MRRGCSEPFFPPTGSSSAPQDWLATPDVVRIVAENSNVCRSAARRDDTATLAITHFEHRRLLIPAQRSRIWSRGAHVIGSAQARTTLVCEPRNPRHCGQPRRGRHGDTLRFDVCRPWNSSSIARRSRVGARIKYARRTRRAFTTAASAAQERERLSGSSCAHATSRCRPTAGTRPRIGVLSRTPRSIIAPRGPNPGRAMERDRRASYARARTAEAAGRHTVSGNAPRRTTPLLPVGDRA